jgi:outer membrane protein W
MPDADCQPFVGPGVNFTTIVVDAEDLGTPGDDLSLGDSFGIATQSGADWMFNDNWLVNRNYAGLTSSLI